jgi:protein-tyrosine kinase
MDRISKALEMAKQGRANAPTVAADQNAVQISYTQTQVVQVSAETLHANRIISGLHDEPLVDMYRILRTRVIRRLHQNNWKTLGVTSARAGDGKTLTAINLGISIAMEPNYSVLVVDADLRRPSVHTFFGLKPQHGLSDFLVSEINVEELFIHPGIERFTILPCTQSSKASSELLLTHKMLRLIHELKNRYPARLVIFNLPPVLVGDDVVALSPLLDAMLLVVQDGKTRADDLARVAELLEDTNLLGSVLNKSSEVHHRYDSQYY